MYEALTNERGKLYHFHRKQSEAPMIKAWIAGLRKVRRDFMQRQQADMLGAAAANDFR